jgi:predicted dehydrogenase
VNVLIIGLGSIAFKHIAALREIEPDVNIYALRSSNEAENYPEIYNIHTIEEMLVPAKFTIISTPTQLHEPAIIQALKLKCPIFIEKPVLGELKNVDILSNAIEQSNVLTYVACNMRFHPAIQFIKQYLDLNRPTINEVNVYCGSYLPEWRPGRDFRNMYSANKEMGGGVHLDLIHELDYCKWLFGCPNQITSIKRSVSSLEIEAADFAQFGLLYNTFTINITLNYYRKDARRRLEIVTNTETLEVNLLTSTVSSLETNKTLYSGIFSMADTYIQQLRFFLEQVDKGGKSMNDFNEGVDVLKMALHE